MPWDPFARLVLRKPRSKKQGGKAQQTKAHRKRKTRR